MKKRFVIIFLPCDVKKKGNDKVYYHQVSNIRCTWVGTAPTTPSFSTEHLASIYCAKTAASWDEKHLSFGYFMCLILGILWYIYFQSRTKHKSGSLMRHILSQNIIMWGNQHIEAETKWPPFPRRHFQMHCFNENVCISIKISLKFVPKGPFDKIPALVQIMAWRRPGDMPLSEPMMVSSTTHICVTRPQWVKNDSIYYIRVIDKVSWAITKLDISNIFYLPNFWNHAFSWSAYIKFGIKLCWNPLAWLVAYLHRSSQRDMWSPVLWCNIFIVIITRVWVTE